MAGSKSNPDNVGGPNEYSGLRVGLSGPIGVPLAPGGNTFDRGEHLSVDGTKGLDQNRSQAKPLGGITEKGFGSII